MVKNIKEKGKNISEKVKTFLVSIIARYKKSGCTATCCAPARGMNQKFAWRLFHQNLAAVHDVDAAAADAA